MSGVCHRFFRHQLLPGIFLGFVVAVLNGCSGSNGIEQRTPPRLEPKPKDDKELNYPIRERIIGMIAPHGAAGGWWFFKLRGPADKVEAQRAAFLEWIKTIQLPEDIKAKPKWKTPTGWTETPGDQIREVLFAIGPEADGLDCGISYVSGSLLDNINRWRDQVGLPPVGSDGLERSYVTQMIDGRLTFLVEVAGPGGTKKKPPFAHPAK